MLYIASYLDPNFFFKKYKSCLMPDEEKVLISIQL